MSSAAMNAHPTISLTTTTTEIQNQQKDKKKDKKNYPLFCKFEVTWLYV
jgi:hypothetical protein